MWLHFIRMIFDDLCLKIYFWPFLSYLAYIKGLCPYYAAGYWPYPTVPPNSSIPTFEPTPPFVITTLEPCPADPLVCLPGGVRPIAYCPCIDPRQQLSQSQLEQAYTSVFKFGLKESVTDSVMVFASLKDQTHNRTRRKKRRTHT